MIYLLAAIFFVMLQAFFSGIETGLVSLRKPRVINGVRKGDRRAVILQFFMERPSLMLASTLLGTNLCVVCAALMVKQAVAAFGFEGKTPMLIATVLLTVVLLAAEIIPKDWFRQAPYLRCAFFAHMLYLSYLILYVPAWLLSRFTDLVVKVLTNGVANQDSKILLREDFRLLLRESEEGGIIDSDDASVLDNAVDFSQITIREIMVPKIKVQTVVAGTSVAEAVAACRRSNCSRLPVTVTTAIGNAGRGGLTWIGTFSIYDAIYKIPEENWPETKIEACLRPLNIIFANSEPSEVIRRSKLIKSPLITVVNPNDPTDYLGIVTPLDVVNYLFSR